MLTAATTVHGVRYVSRRLGVAASSASVTQPVAKGNSEVLHQDEGIVDPPTRCPSGPLWSAAPLGGTATGTVTFSVSSWTVGALAACEEATVSPGIRCGDLRIATLGSSGSTHAVTASYSGDSTFAASDSNNRTLTVG